MRVLDDLPTLDVLRRRRREHLSQHGGDREVSVNDADLLSSRFLIQLRVLFGRDAGGADDDVLSASDGGADVVEGYFVAEV